MYTFVLAVHSFVRWVVIVAGLIAFGRALMGATGRRRWTRVDERAGFWFVGAFDFQLLLGLFLYLALSPITRAAMADFGEAMRSAGMRFWAAEHVFGMIVGLALAHVGRARTRKLTDDVARHKVAAICYGLALAAVLVSIPWPGLPNARPLIRLITW